MGIFDKLKGAVGGKVGIPTEEAAEGDVTGAVSSLLGEGGSGLSGLLDKFNSGGLGDLAQSWVGKGDNLPVSGDQIKAILDSEQLSAVASKLGISPDEAASKVASVLPQIIDKVTPDGIVPDPEALSQKVTGLLNL